MLVLSQTDVEAALDIPSLVDAVGTAMVDLSTGEASAPPRVAAMVASQGALLAAMPAYLPSVGALTTKLVSLFPGNRDRPTHQALICCFDPGNGTPVAVLDGTWITALRTAAGSSLAARVLARPDSKTVAIVGTGVQARSHLAVFAAMAQGERYVIAGREPAAAEALAAEAAGRHGIGVDVATVADAVAGADIVCATTHADAPVVTRELVTAGTHVSSVGYNSTGRGEVDGRLVADAVVVVESREAVLSAPPAGAVELHLAFENGDIDQDFPIAELGEVLTGRRPGRTDPDDITLYKSVGVAVQDAAAAALVLGAARELGLGVEVPI